MNRMIARANGSKGGNDDTMVAETEPQVVAPVIETVTYVKPKKRLQMPVPSIGEDYYIQVGSFSDPDNAEAARAELASVWPVQMLQLDGNNGTIFRVRVGPLSNEDDASTALEHAQSLGHNDARMIIAQSMQAALQ
jgi:rare lipoprotein A